MPLDHPRLTRLCLVAFVACLPVCRTSSAAERAAAATAPSDVSGPTIEAKHGVVVSVSRPASEVGRDTMKAGGNAVDAAVATAFAMAVTWPEAGNIGGGGFMLVRPGKIVGPNASDQPVMIDYRETAPATATPDMYATKKPNSYAIAGVPGTVRGLAMAHAHYGLRPWRELVVPAVRLAAEGFEVDAALARSLNGGLRNADEFPEMRRVFARPGGGDWRAGDRLVQPDLAATLKRITDEGPDAFYAGETARLIVEEMKRGGGGITADDLAHYEAKIREPLRGTFRGYELIVPPPPSSGGVSMLLMLNMLEPFDLKDGPNGPATLHLMIEAMRRAYADRARYLGDPDFTDAPVARLTSKAYAAELAKTIDPTKATRSEDVAPWATVEDGGEQTTHFSVIDRDGMAVSNTYTLEHSFGGKIVVRGAGFLLNNELGDFNPKPGVTTRTGLIGTPPNQVQPNKRPLSSMTPTIVLKDGRIVLVTGSPGGRTIINTVFRVVLNRIGLEMSLRDAVDVPRLHHQWFPDVVHVEKRMAEQHPEAIEALKKLGHQVDVGTFQGDAHSIAIDPATGVYTGVADQRLHGTAAGY